MWRESIEPKFAIMFDEAKELALKLNLDPSELWMPYRVKQSVYRANSSLSINMPAFKYGRLMEPDARQAYKLV